MKRIWNVLVPLLAAGILCAGFFGVGLARRLLPDGRNIVQEYEKPAEENQLFHVDGQDTLTFFPWNDAYYMEVEPMPLDYWGADEDERIFYNDRIWELLYLWADAGPDSGQSFDEALRVRRGMYFLEDYPCMGAENGKKYRLDMAFATLDMEIYYWHVEPVEAQSPTQREMEEADEMLSGLPEQIQKGDYNNPLSEYLSRISGASMVGDVLLEAVNTAGQTSRLIYRDEILLAFHISTPLNSMTEGMTNDEAAAQTGTLPPSTVVFFYNVAEQQFTGFCWQ